MKLNRWLVVLAACVGMLGVTFRSFADAPAATASPLAEVRRTVDEVLKVVEALPGDANVTVRRQKLRDIINPVFNFGEMSKRSLGASWNDINADQQKEFVAVFSDLLARTYLGKIETVKPNMVKFDSENVEFPRAVVKTTIESKGDLFPLDYKMLNENGSWRVYDVVIENIGLVANYRNEFAGIMRRETFDGLLKRLKEKA